jgi:hypothetical protein
MLRAPRLSAVVLVNFKIRKTLRPTWELKRWSAVFQGGLDKGLIRSEVRATSALRCCLVIYVAFVRCSAVKSSPGNEICLMILI